MALKVDYLQAGTYTAKDDRSAEGAALVSTGNLTWRTGVLLGDGTDLKVTANGTPNMTVNAAVGQAICPCSGDAQSAPYTVTSDAITNLGIATANATNPRKDLVCLTVRDAFYSGANNDAILQVITGTAAPTPTLPATPTNSIALSEVDVAANATSITSGNIIDLRTYTVGRGGVLPVLSTARPSAPYAGMQIFETDTKLIQVWDGTAWFPLSLGWTAFTPSWTNLTVGNGNNVGSYQVVGKSLFLRIAISFGSTTSVGGSVSVALPSGFTTASGLSQDIPLRVGAAGGGQLFVGFSTIGASSSALTLWEPASSSSTLCSQVGSFGQTFGSGSNLFIQGVLQVA